uniref:Uncharacterized protein LOC114324334 n=1 Tax=Diabrotica virgifera virgifera TaxID=50390 RepID=A0A6P7EXP4_DIAVI
MLQFFLSYYMNTVVVSVTVIQICLIVKSLKTLLKVINDDLQQAFKENLTLNDILCIQKHYEEIVNCINIVSDIYGWPLLMIFGKIILVLIHGVFIPVKLLLNGKDFEILPMVALSCALQMAVFMGCGVIISFSCDQTSNEAHKTSDICYRILINSSQVLNKVQRCNLLLLAKYITSNKKYVFAVAVPVKKSILLEILGSVAAYLSLILQYKPTSL